MVHNNLGNGTINSTMDATRALAQKGFIAAMEEVQREGIDDADIGGVFRGVLMDGGFDFASRKSIDHLFNIVDEEFKSYKHQEEELMNEFRQILIEAGSTELELILGNVGNARLNKKQYRKLSKIAREIDKVREAVLEPMTIAAVLNEAKDALE